MKKRIIVFLLLLSTFSIYSQVNIYKPEIADYLFNNYDITTNDLHLWIYNYKSKSQLAGIIFSRDGNIKLYVGTSGYYFGLPEIEITDNFLTVSFVKIWVGAEESNINDSRLLMKYRSIVDKETIENNTSWILKIYDVQPIFKAEDACNSLKNYNIFSVKEEIEVRKEASKDSQSIFILSSGSQFDIIDINCTSNDKNDLWLKIFYNEVYGYIPLSSLADDWKIVKNDLDKFTVTR